MQIQHQSGFLALRHSLSTITMLASLTFPSFAATAHEPVDGVLPTIRDHTALDAKQRLELLSALQQNPPDLSTPEMRQQYADSIAQILTSYQDALCGADDLSSREVHLAQQIAISTLNIHSFKDRLPPEQSDAFICNHVLSLHTALIDRLHNCPPVDMDRQSVADTQAALFGDLLWTHNFDSSKILDHACQLFGQRIFEAPDTDFQARVNMFSSSASTHPPARSRPILLNTLLNATKQHLTHQALSEESCRVVGGLLEQLAKDSGQNTYLSQVTNTALTEKGENPRFLSLLGRAWGERIMGRACTEFCENGQPPPVSIQTHQAVSKLLQTGLTRSDPAQQPISTQQKSSELEELPSHLMQHVLYGNRFKELGGLERATTWGERQGQTAHRLRSLRVLVGMLAAMDANLQVAEQHDQIEVVERLLTTTKPSAEISLSAESRDVVLQSLTQLREQYRTALDDLILQDWSDEERAHVVVALLEIDHARFQTLVCSERYRSLRLPEIAKHFPDVGMANRDGRYRSKIGGIVYFPPALYEGVGAPYADGYFLLRYSFVTMETGRSYDNARDIPASLKPLDKLAREYAESSQSVFLAEFVRALWGEHRLDRSIGTYYGLSDQRMMEETLEILETFSCFRYDIELQQQLSRCDAKDFLPTIEEFYTDSLKRRIRATQAASKYIESKDRAKGRRP